MTAELKARLDALADDAERVEARDWLVAQGGAVTVAVVGLLYHEQQSVRREAAKVLADLQDDACAPVLAANLVDDNGDIRWIVAEGLATLAPGHPEETVPVLAFKALGRLDQATPEARR